MRRQKAYALMVSMVLLSILTVIAVFSLQNTGLELKISSNAGRSTQAFEASEAARALVLPLIDAHIDQRGWPRALGGQIDDGAFRQPIPQGLSLRHDAGAEPRHWEESILIDAKNLAGDPREDADVVIERTVAPVGTQALSLRATVAVLKLRLGALAGNGMAMSDGYAGTGTAAANGGSGLYFYLLSRGQDPDSLASSRTASVYRHVIRN